MHTQVFESNEGFFSFLRRIVLQQENGRRGTAEKAHSAENIKASRR